jgi:hypothetical protein
MKREILCGGLVDLRCGDWREVLEDVDSCDSLICDPPYSQRVEDGFRSGNDATTAHGMGYRPIDNDDSSLLVSEFAKRAKNWLVIFGCHLTWRQHEDHARSVGLYTFAPVVWCKIGAAPRMSGDGPASHCEYAMIARHKRADLMGSGSRPGWYQANTVRHGHGHVGVSGAKPIDLMRALVRDYSRPGDLIVDPFCGSGTTALACAMEGRRCITSELDPKTFEIARRRLSAPTQRSLLP